MKSCTVERISNFMGEPGRQRAHGSESLVLIASIAFEALVRHVRSDAEGHVPFALGCSRRSPANGAYVTGPSEKWSVRHGFSSERASGLFAHLRGKQEVDERPPENFIARVAGHLLGRAVEQDDFVVPADTHDQVWCELDRVDVMRGHR